MSEDTFSDLEAHMFHYINTLENKVNVPNDK